MSHEDTADNSMQKFMNKASEDTDECCVKRFIKNASFHMKCVENSDILNTETLLRSWEQEDARLNAIADKRMKNPRVVSVNPDDL